MLSQSNGKKLQMPSRAIALTASKNILCRKNGNGNDGLISPGQEDGASRKSSKCRKFTSKRRPSAAASVVFPEQGRPSMAISLQSEYDFPIISTTSPKSSRFWHGCFGPETDFTQCLRR